MRARISAVALLVLAACGSAPLTSDDPSEAIARHLDRCGHSAEGHEYFLADWLVRDSAGVGQWLTGSTDDLALDRDGLRTELGLSDDGLHFRGHDLDVA